jgi:hypothetical protein
MTANYTVDFDKIEQIKTKAGEIMEMQAKYAEQGMGGAKAFSAACKELKLSKKEAEQILAEDYFYDD